MTSPKKRARSSSSSESKHLYNPSGNGQKRRLFFPGTFGSRDLRLVEVPPDMIDIISSGQNLKIVGDPSKGDTVLCSEDRTFSLRKVETSNHIFLVPPSSDHEFQLECSINEYYEIKPVAGKIGRIRSLLETHVYTGESGEAENAKHRHSFLTRAQLWAEIQASDAEMEVSLRALGVVELDGFMRMLSPEAVSAVSRDLLDTAMVSDWDLSNLDESDCATAMPDTDRVLLRHVLGALGKFSETTNSWVLDQGKVARKTAHMLFESRQAETNSRGDAWPVQDFLLEWGARNPGTGQVRAELLLGIAVLIRDSSIKNEERREVYKYAPAESITLLSSCRDRLDKLFAIKPKFPKDQLEPYLGDLVGGTGQPKSMDELLLANARFVQSENVYMQK